MKYIELMEARIIGCFGLYDTQDNLWVGDNDTPFIYEDANAASDDAIVLNKQMGTPLRFRPSIFDVHKFTLKDDLIPLMSHDEASNKLIAEALLIEKLKTTTL